MVSNEGIGKQQCYILGVLEIFALSEASFFSGSGTSPCKSHINKKILVQLCPLK